MEPPNADDTWDAVYQATFGSLDGILDFFGATMPYFVVLTIGLTVIGAFIRYVRRISRGGV